MAGWLKQADDWARENNPPVQMLSDLAGIPAITKTLERKGYGEPLTSGKGMTRKMKPDTEEAILGALNFAPAVGPAAKLTEKYGVPAAQAMARNAMIPSTLSKEAGVIKVPGGNWLSGSVEDSLKGLKTSGPIPRIAPGRYERPMPDKAIDDWIDKKLASYVKNDMATERDPIRLAADAWPKKKGEQTSVIEARLDKAKADMETARQARGFTPEMMTSSQARIRAIEKDKDLLNLQEGLHGVPDRYAMSRGQEQRVAAGFPVEGSGVGPEAKRWENQSDISIGTLPAEQYQKTVGPSWEANKWLDKVDPSTPVHRASGTARGFNSDTGFDHLIDELRNATNAESGLPKHLLLDPKDLGKVAVPQAVERVAQINAWRQAQKIEANQMLANNAATVLHKEYPEKGMKWVELKKNDQIPEGAVTFDRRGYYGGDVGPVSKADAERHAKMATLKDALKYEGDTMKHCVGGYCDKVADGSTRIFSLRDTKTGQPHVTIETVPLTENKAIQNLKAEFGDNWEDYADPRLLAANEKSGARILQIKGKGNKKPNDEYLPFVQDFVKSQKWSDVGDLQNTGLLHRKTLTSAEQAGLAPEQNYLTMEEIQELRKGKPWVPIDTDPEFAKGGLVSTHDYNPEHVATLASALAKDLALSY
jgi:hypothetical protein